MLDSAPLYCLMLVVALKPVQATRHVAGKSAFPPEAGKPAGVLLRPDKPALGRPVGTAPPDSSISGLAPPVPSRPFLRALVWASLGFIICLAFLAHKLRRYIGLGVFANRFSIAFLALGALACCVPGVLEFEFPSVVGRLSPWPDVSAAGGLFLLLTVAHSNDLNSQLGGPKGRMPSFLVDLFVQWIIGDLLPRVRSEISAAASRHDWRTIVRASEVIVAEQTAVRELTLQDGDVLISGIKDLQRTYDKRRGQDNDERKRLALFRLFSCCSIKRFREALAAASKERKG